LREEIVLTIREIYRKYISLLGHAIFYYVIKLPPAPFSPAAPRQSERQLSFLRFSACYCCAGWQKPQPVLNRAEPFIALMTLKLLVLAAEEAAGLAIDADRA